MVTGYFAGKSPVYDVEKISDTNIGEMGYGAIIVQCSTNGINWGKNEIKKSANYLNNKTSEGY